MSGDTPPAQLLCELLRLFYAKDWVSGTGGGICGLRSPGELLVAPTGVHKERVQPQDLFVVDTHSGAVLEPPADTSLRPSECTGVFTSLVRLRGAGSVVHSHALSAVLAADRGSREVEIAGFEMLKGIRGVTNADRHVVPVLANTARESELVGAVEQVCGDDRYRSVFAILVADHGAYIWGDDIWEAKRHAEVYHWLFEGIVRRDRRSSR